MDSYERRAADLVLQTYALFNVIGTGRLTNINMLILTLRQAAQDVPQDYFDKHQRLSNLGLALRVSYHLCGDLDDLNESITTHMEAMRSSLRVCYAYRPWCSVPQTIRTAL